MSSHQILTATPTRLRNLHFILIPVQAQVDEIHTTHHRRRKLTRRHAPPRPPPKRTAPVRAPPPSRLLSCPMRHIMRHIVGVLPRGALHHVGKLERGVFRKELDHTLWARRAEVLLRMKHLEGVVVGQGAAYAPQTRVPDLREGGVESGPSALVLKATTLLSCSHITFAHLINRVEITFKSGSFHRGWRGHQSLIINHHRRLGGDGEGRAPGCGSG